MDKIDKEERAYRAALYEAEGIGPARFRVLVDYFKSAAEVWRAGSKDLKEVGLPEKLIAEIEQRKKMIDPKSHLLALAKLNIRILLIEDEEYPALLKEISNPPQVLFVRGSFQGEDDCSLAVVGTRKPTGYGKEVTEKLVEQLVANGFTVVSGLARGIDGIAHRAALMFGGRTLAVLGGGVERVYPPEHKGLAEEISHHGAVVSEFAPGKLPVPGNFPARNRVISGLSLGVLVIEGASKSGTKITASLAVEQGREVFAVPGPITSSQSQATADLIKMGVKAVTGIDDILEELETIRKKLVVKTRTKSNVVVELSEEEKKIAGVLGEGQLYIDEIVRRSKGGVAEVSSTLTMMELKGVVRHLGGMVYCLAGFEK